MKESSQGADKNADGGALIKTAAKGGVLGFVGAIGGRALGMVLAVLVGNLYGRSCFGLFVTGVLVCRISQTVAGLGLQKGGMRFMAIAVEKDDRDAMWDVYRAALLIPLAVGTVASVLLYMGAPLLAEVCFKDALLTDVLRYLAIAVPFVTTMRILADISRAFKTVKYAVLVEEVMFPVLQIALFGLFLMAGYEFMSVVYGFVLSSVICCCSIVVLLSRQLRRAERRASAERGDRSERGAGGFHILPGNCKELMMYSLPLIPMGLLWMSGNTTDVVMINILKESSAVGEYTAAYRWVFFFVMITRPLNLIFAPLMAGQFGVGKKDELQKLYATSTRWIFFLTIPLFVFQMIARVPLMRIFGDDFVATGPSILAVLLIGAMFAALTNPAGNLLMVSGNQIKELVCLGVSMALNITMNLLWIPRYGVMGAAMATTCSLIFGNVMRISLVKRYLGLFPFSRLYVVPAVGLLVASGAGVILLRMVEMGVVGQVLVGCVAGGMMPLVVLFAGLDNGDKELFKSVVARVRRGGGRPPPGMGGRRRRERP